MNSRSQEFFASNPKLCDLHVHIGSITHPALLWDIAHECGLTMPVKNYWEFQKMIVVKDKIEGGNEKDRLNRYLKFFDLTEKIQSSPYAMNRVVYEAVSGAYRKNNITCLELRFCPMWRNNKGSHDLDQIMIATVHALDRSMIACPEVNTLYQEAIRNGLKTTSHLGEEGSVAEMASVVDILPLHRIGHGIKAHLDPQLMRKLVELDICLEICPTSNLKLGIIKDIAELRFIIRTFLKHGVQFTINTDGPELLQTAIKDEIAILLDNEIVTTREMEQIISNSFKYSFISDS
jgi:adenosine deaminase